MFALLFVVLAQDSDTLEKIRDAVHDNRAIDSLELRYFYEDPKAKEKTPKYTWAFQGQRFLFAYEGGKSFYTKFGNKQWMSFDGAQFYHLHFDEAGEMQMNRSPLKPPHPGFPGSSEPRFSFGWEIVASDQSLNQLLEAARLDGKAEIDGHSCWKVDLGENSFEGNKTNHLRAWFDPAVGYWPRRIEIRPHDFKIGQPNTLRSGQVYGDYRILEFDKVEDGQTGRKRWFPKRCQFDQFPMKKVDIVVEDVRINHPIPDERFIPDLSD
jgi:hypothetical protein